MILIRIDFQFISYVPYPINISFIASINISYIVECKIVLFSVCCFLAWSNLSRWLIITQKETIKWIQNKNKMYTYIYSKETLQCNVELGEKKSGKFYRCTQNKRFTVLHKVKWFAIGFGKTKNAMPCHGSQSASQHPNQHTDIFNGNSHHTNQIVHAKNHR